MTVYASSTARTVFVGAPNQSVVGPLSRSKSWDESGPSARIRSSTRAATSAFSASVSCALRLVPRNHANSLAGTKESPLLYASKIVAPLVEQVAPSRVVVRDARVQHEVVAPPRDGDRVELDRAELAEDLEHGVGASLERSRRREEVPRNEETARGLSGDPHPEDASYPDVLFVETPRPACTNRPIRFPRGRCQYYW